MRFVASSTIMLAITSTSAFNRPYSVPSPHLHPIGRSRNKQRVLIKKFHPHENFFYDRPLSFKKSSSTSLGVISQINEIPRGGASLSLLSKTPDGLYNTTFGALMLLAIIFKLFPTLASSMKSVAGQDEQQKQQQNDKPPKPFKIKSLQYRFLLVFWLLRCADWLQGPYFYDVYKSKIIGGIPVSIGLISKIFLTGFASTALFGPFVGRFADSRGRKKGTLAFCALYALGAMSTKSGLLSVLLLGRLVNGIGTSLLFSAPEAWLVGETSQIQDGGSYLGETFGLAYAGDSLVAILAGKMSGIAASQRGPTGPFELSTIILIIGAIFTSILWKENVANSSSSQDDNLQQQQKEDSKPTIREAVNVVKSDPKIILTGATQSLFEAAMYIFVLQWPPALTSAISKAFPNSVAGTPYGTIFSCFMACCLLGSTTFGQLVKSIPGETFSSGMLSLATVAMGAATYATSVSASSALSPAILLSALSLSFFLFEACVGMYFPSIGTLRSKYVPDSHRSVIMNLFGIPLNVLVVTVFLINEKLGVSGALGVSTGILGLATLCMMKLRGMTISKKVKNTDGAS